MSNDVDVSKMRDSALVREAIKLAGGKAVKLCDALHFGVSSVSEWKRGRRRIPKNERRRIEEYVQHQSEAMPEEYRELIERARRQAPELIAREWDPQYKAIMDRANADIGQIMARVNEEVGRLFHLVTKLERAQAAVAKEAGKAARVATSNGRKSA